MPDQAVSRLQIPMALFLPFIHQFCSLLLQPFLVKLWVDVGKKVLDQFQVGLRVTDLAAYVRLFPIRVKGSSGLIFGNWVRASKVSRVALEVLRRH